MRERGRERERWGREISISCLLHVPQLGTELETLGMCPDWESNPQPLGVADDIPTNWAPWPGLFSSIFNSILISLIQSLFPFHPSYLFFSLCPHSFWQQWQEGCVALAGVGTPWSWKPILLQAPEQSSFPSTFSNNLKLSLQKMIIFPCRRAP